MRGKNIERGSKEGPGVENAVVWSSHGEREASGGHGGLLGLIRESLSGNQSSRKLEAPCPAYGAVALSFERQHGGKAV